jgi:hypothetical protein
MTAIIQHHTTPTCGPTIPPRTRRCTASLACAVLSTTMLLAGCSGSDGPTPVGVPVKVLLSEGTPAPPALVNGECVVFTVHPTAEQVYAYQTAPVPDIFAHIGDSIRQCMSGTAQPYLGDIPQSYFYRATLYFNLNGSCPPHSSGCYYPNNPTVDQIQTHWLPTAAQADWQLSAIIGHEVWHAVAGSFHP